MNYRTPVSVILRSLLFWLVVSSAAAFLWPTESVGFDPFRVSAAWLWTLIAITMFCLGTLVRPAELRPLRNHPWWVVLGVLAQVTVMPIAAWTVCQVVPMPADIAAGVILVGCVPGAMASNVLTHTARGSVAFSVSLTTVATLMSPITVPVVIQLFAGELPDQPLTWISIRLALLVVLPTCLGYALSLKIIRVREWAECWAAVIASAALLWIIASVVAKTRSQLLEVSVVLLLALLAINVVGYVAGYFAGAFARVPESYRRALCLEVGMQNAGLGTALAVSMYGAETLATIPTASYTFGCMLTGTVLAIVWRGVGSDAIDHVTGDGEVSH